MYFKDNGKGERHVAFVNSQFVFNHFEFSKIQQWLEVGQCLQKIFDLHMKLKIEIIAIESEHGPILKQKYDKISGFISGIPKPIKGLFDTEEIKYLCRLIEETYNSDLHTIYVVCDKVKDMRTYKNLIEQSKAFLNNSKISRHKIEENFDFITITSLERGLVEFWDEIRKHLDEITNEIIMPEPSNKNKEFFQYFIDARDNYCLGNKEIALAIIRKGLEDILTRLWILKFDKIEEVTLNDNLDNLPGKLSTHNIINEQQMRDILALIKYGNAGIHVKAEIPIERVNQYAKLKINAGISLIEDLSSIYEKLMLKKKYSLIKLQKTDFEVVHGDF